MCKRSKRLNKFEEQLPDAIDLFNRDHARRPQHSQRSGDHRHGDPDPVRMEFKKLMEELALARR